MEFCFRLAKPQKRESGGKFDVSRLRSGAEAESLSRNLREDVLAHLPDPDDRSIGINDLYAQSIEAATGALARILGKPERPEFAKNWLLANTQKYVSQGGDGGGRGPQKSCERDVLCFPQNG